MRSNSPAKADCSSGVAVPATMWPATLRKAADCSAGRPRSAMTRRTTATKVLPLKPGSLHGFFFPPDSSFAWRISSTVPLS